MLQILSTPPLYRWLLTLAFVAIIVALSVTPERGQQGDSIFAWLVTHTAPTLQKLLHVAVYAALAMLWMWTLDDVRSQVLRIALTLLLTVGLGAALEWYQTRVPGRFGTVVDALLNALGAIGGTVLAIIVL